MQCRVLPCLHKPFFPPFHACTNTADNYETRAWPSQPAYKHANIWTPASECAAAASLPLPKTGQALVYLVVQRGVSRKRRGLLLHSLMQEHRVFLLLHRPFLPYLVLLDVLLMHIFLLVFRAEFLLLPPLVLLHLLLLCFLWLLAHSLNAPCVIWPTVSIILRTIQQTK